MKLKNPTPIAVYNASTGGYLGALLIRTTTAGIRYVRLPCEAKDRRFTREGFEMGDQHSTFAVAALGTPR